MATTPKLNLNKPATSAQDVWGAQINANFDTLDDANVLTVGTAGEGGFLAVAVHSGVRGVASQILDIANRVRVHQFVLPWRQAIGKAVIDIEAAFAAGKAAVGLYNAAGNSLLVNSGVIDTTATGIQTKIITPSFVIEAGVYMFAWTGDNTTFKFRSFSSGDTVLNIITENGSKVGNAANPSVAGVLPATLGAITSIPLNTPGAYFEP